MSEFGKIQKIGQIAKSNRPIFITRKITKSEFTVRIIWIRKKRDRQASFRERFTILFDGVTRPKSLLFSVNSHGAKCDHTHCQKCHGNPKVSCYRANTHLDPKIVE